MKTLNKLVTFMAMAMLSVSALADKEPRQGFYISPEIGNFTIKDYCKEVGSLVGQATCTESEIGFGLLGGYQFNDFIAAEAGIRIASGFDSSTTINTTNVKLDFDYTSYSLGGAARYPIGERLAITGKAGYHFWDVDANVGGGGVSATFSDDGTDLYLGGGLEFIATDKVSFRAEYTRYELDDTDVDVISGRLVIHF